MALVAPRPQVDRAVIAAVLFVAGAMTIACEAPYQASLIAAAFLAGPHNWMELRYFATHMPARWGPERDWFRLALFGALVMAVTSAAGTWLGGWLEDDGTAWRSISCGWTSALVLWATLLVDVRRRCRGQARSAWTTPACVAALSLIWGLPLPWELVFVFVHPVISLLFLDRELRRQPHRQRALRLAAALLPLLLGAVWLGAGPTPTMLTTPGMHERITGICGAELLSCASPQRVVAVYVFLQLLHYAAWIVAIPSLRLRSNPFSPTGIPLVRRASGAVIGVLALGLGVVALLWAGFALSPAATWDIYFQLAIVHVVVEVPFLVRKLVA